MTGSGDRRGDVAAKLLNECGHVTCTSGLEYPPRGQGRVLQLTVATSRRGHGAPVTSLHHCQGPATTVAAIS